MLKPRKGRMTGKRSAREKTETMFEFSLSVAEEANDTQKGIGNDKRGKGKKTQEKERTKSTRRKGD